MVSRGRGWGKRKLLFSGFRVSVLQGGNADVLYNVRVVNTTVLST